MCIDTLLQGSESAGDSAGPSSTTVVDLEIKMEDLRQALRKAQVRYLCVIVPCSGRVIFSRTHLRFHVMHFAELKFVKAQQK